MAKKALVKSTTIYDFMKKLKIYQHLLVEKNKNKTTTTKNQQDLSPDRIAYLILHFLFLENSKSLTLILT